MALMSTQQCQLVIVDVFSDQGGVDLLKGITEGGHNPPHPPPPKDQVCLGANAECAG